MRTIPELRAWVTAMPPGQGTDAALGLIERLARTEEQLASMPNALELRVASELLTLAKNEFSNHGCNDWAWPDWFPKDQRKAFSLAIETWNGSSAEEAEENAEHDAKGKYGPVDFMLMGYLADRLNKAANP